MPRSLTQEEFLTKAEKVSKSHYDLSRVLYVSAKTKVEIVCRNHDSFWITPNNFLSGKGCPNCAAETRGKEERDLHASLFLDKCAQKQGDRYYLDKVVYLGTDTKIIVGCRTHGDFETLPSNFLKGKGCPACANIRRGMLSRLSQTDFISSVMSANCRYSPSERTVYKTYAAQTHFKCSEHGEFKAQAKTLLQGSGCPGCAAYGYSTSIPATFYLLQNGEMTKLGITNRMASDRAKSVSKSCGSQFRVIAEYKFEDGAIPLNIETALLRELRATHKQPTEKFDGSTECFYDVNLPALLSRIQELIEEHSNAPNRLNVTNREDEVQAR